MTESPPSPGRSHGPIVGRIRWLRKLYDWTRAWSGRPAAGWVLLAIACADSIFFPVPSEALLFALYSARPRWSVWYATVAAIGTALGAILGYAIGHLLREPTLDVLRWLADERVDAVRLWLANHAFWAVFLGSFTPFSDKLLVLASGVFGVPFWLFTVAYTLGRATRTYPAAVLFQLLGPWIERWLERYLEIVSIAFAAAVAIGLAAVLLWPA